MGSNYIGLRLTADKREIKDFSKLSLATSYMLEILGDIPLLCLEKGKFIKTIKYILKEGEKI
jgi:hypothetical protein